VVLSGWDCSTSVQWAARMASFVMEGPGRLRLRALYGPLMVGLSVILVVYRRRVDSG